MGETICVDFDHTLVNIDKPLPGAKEAMQTLRDMGFHIMIYSCNDADWIRKVLNTHDIHYNSIYEGYRDGRAYKPACFAYIDDRGVGFDGDWNKAVQEVVGMEQRRAKIKGAVL